MDMGWEIAFGVGALVLLTALIFGVLQYHYRDRRAVRVGEEVTRERYRKDAA
ncbi:MULTISPECIES: hypothetical protein [unclassified Bradyrhizobium]|uniref:hypothetical protein n=1 Tax=unclassified Bradyrhizobium TaxID=2631580 RepID=UPI00247A35CF|nr:MULTISPECIES: hypothetical protein [unclassified Bradyrhizobium]WGS17948.1 hypothetical protein MTX22_25500 [Bradyrhizobium sp. ISRA463]WGS24754.1 hypothetical protein MTX19_23160 [Bradyrhizobium sp. ISRA464]